MREELGVVAEPVREPDGALRLPLTGENVHPSSVAADPALAPLREAADLLAARRWDRPCTTREAGGERGSGRRLRVRPRHVRGSRALAGHAPSVTGGVTLVEDTDRHHDGLRRSGPEVLGRLEAALQEAAPAPWRPRPSARRGRPA